MQLETIIAAVAGIVVGFIIGKLSGRQKSRTVWSERVDVDKIPPEITELAMSGRKIQAIKRYRQMFNVDLKEAKEAVDALQERKKALE